jgi:NADPH:quinone reductase-like Zn-dependent oxidoreductase
MGRRLGRLPRLLGLVARSPFDERLPRVDVSMPDKADTLTALAALVDAGRLTPVLDGTSRSTTCPPAIRRLESGDARGKIVVTM